MGNSKELNFAFWGTPDVALETLEILKEKGFMPSLIITSPDSRRGRGLQLMATSVAMFAEKNKIPCLKPDKLDENFASQLKAFKLKLSIVVAYGKIIPETILEIPLFGSINIHYSLLPKYRGASPVETALINGDTETGVTIQKMVKNMDAGDILLQEKVLIGDEETTPELRARLIKIGGKLLVTNLPELLQNKIPSHPQIKAEATYASKIKKEDGLIDLEGDARQNYNKFRAYYAWPRVFFFQNGKRIIITEAEFKNGRFIIKKVLPEGRREITWAEFERANTSR